MSKHILFKLEWEEESLRRIPFPVRFLNLYRKGARREEYQKVEDIINAKQYYCDRWKATDEHAYHSKLQ